MTKKTTTTPTSNNQNNNEKEKEQKNTQTPPKIRTIRIICNDPDATDDSSDDEKPTNANTNKQIVREVHLDLSCPKKIDPNADLQQKKRRKKERDYSSRRHERFVGVRRRNSGRWSCEIKDRRVSDRKIWLGTFDTPEEAAQKRASYKNWVDSLMRSSATELQRVLMNKSPTSVLHDSHDDGIASEFEEETRESSCNDELVLASENLLLLKRKIRANECGRESVNRALVFDKTNSNEDVNEEGGNSEGSSMAKDLLSASISDDDNCLFRDGPVIIDKHGSILGEYSWLDDLQICDYEGRS